MRRLLFVFALAFLSLPASAQLQSMQGVATGTLVNYPLGSQAWAIGFENLPTSTSGSNRPLVILNYMGSPAIECWVNANELSLSCFDSSDSFVNGVGTPKVFFTGLTDYRVVFTRFKDTVYGETRIDGWKGDCSGHTYSVQQANAGAEPSTTSGTFQVGDSSAKIRFLRADVYVTNSVFYAPACPADAPPVSGTAYMDFRFDGASPTLVDSAGHQTLTGSGIGYTTSMTYNPSCSITSSADPIRVLPVFDLVPFTLTSTSMIHSGNGVPVSFAWTQTSGPTATIASPSSASTLITPSAGGSQTFQLVVGDGSTTSLCSLNVGIVPSDSNGNRLPSGNALLEKMVGPGPLARYGTSAYSWADNVDRQNNDFIGPYWQAPPAPATLFAGTGSNDMFFSGRGPFTGVLSDSYDVKISATGSPDSYQWRKNGGSWSSSIPIVLESHPCYGSVHSPPAVTDGVVACFASASGHTLNDMWTRMAPQVGTGSITHTSANNHLDGNYGGVCGGAVNCFSTRVEVVGSGTTWQSGDATHKLIAGDYYYVLWDADNNGTWSGRYVTTIDTVVDNTHVLLSLDEWDVPEALSGSVKFQMVGLNDDRTLYSGTFQPDGTLIYYDAPLGAVRFSLATNLDVYTNYATAACNNWFVYGIDHGFRINDPREIGYQSMLACAAFLGTTSTWVGTYPATSGSKTPGSGLGYSLSYYNTHGGSSVATDQPRDSTSWLVSDPRGNAFYMGGQALMVYADPTNSAKWCTEIQNNITHYWLLPWVGSLGRWTLLNSGQDGYLQENLTGGTGIAYPAAGNPAGPASSSVIFGTSGWRNVGLPADKFNYVYQALNDSSACPGQSTLAASVQTAAIQMGRTLWDQARSADGGLTYNFGYSTPQFAASPTSWNIWNIPASGGAQPTASVSVSGFTLTSSSAARTQFTKLFASGNGTPHISLNGGGGVQIDAVVDDATLTLHTSQTYSGSTFAGTGTVTVTNGSPTITFTNVNASALFTPCDGSTYFTAADPGGNSATYKVLNGTCTTTQATLNVNYAGMTNTTANFALVVQAASGCSPAIGNQCEPNAFGSGVSLAHDWAMALGQVYTWTNDATWKTRLEYALGGLYGGPAAGPEYVGPPTGPQALGTPSNFMQNVPACNENNLQGPCTDYQRLGGEFSFNEAKPYGMSAGTGNMRNALAIENMAITQTGVRLPSNVRIFGAAR